MSTAETPRPTTRKRRRHRSRPAPPTPQQNHTNHRLDWSLIWRLLLPLRACFWGLNWIRWINTKFPPPPEDAEVAPLLQTIVITSLFFIAYAFYSSHQITSLNTLAHNFLASFTPVSLLNVSVFIIGLFIIYAYLLTVPSRQLWAPLSCIALPLGIAAATFTLQYTRWHMVPGEGTSPQDGLLWFVSGWVCITSTLAFLYVLYRAIKTRLNAYLMHPVLTPLIELTLSAKALAVALVGQATVLWLPFVPGRLLVIALPGAMVMYYLHQTLAAHRTFLAKCHNTSTRQVIWLTELWHEIGPARALWRFAGTATFRLGVALALLIAVLVFFPTGLADSDLLRH